MAASQSQASTPGAPVSAEYKRRLAGFGKARPRHCLWFRWGRHIWGDDWDFGLWFPFKQEEMVHIFHIYISMNVLYYCFKNLMK